MADGHHRQADPLTRMIGRARLVQTPQDATLNPAGEQAHGAARCRDGFIRAFVVAQHGGLARHDRAGVGQKRGEGIGHMAGPGAVLTARTDLRRGVLREDAARGVGQHGGCRIVPHRRDLAVQRLCVLARQPAHARQYQDGRAKAAATDGAEDKHGFA
jgi:hypothetical protein